MKKYFIIITFLFGLILNINAQKTEYFTNDTVQGAETIYFTYSKGTVSEYGGVIGFQFTKTDIADSCSVLRIEGSIDNSAFVGLSGNAALTETTTDGTTILYEETPIYRYYRLAATCAVGDTVKFENVRFIWKKE
jgi:hypothetical protein